MFAKLTILFLLVFIIFYTVRFYTLSKQTELLFKESEKFIKDYYVGDSKLPARTYLVLGDSTSVGTGVENREETYPYLIASAYAAQGYYVHVINRAENGARMSDMDNQLNFDAKIDLLTIVVGANDVTHRTSAEVYESDMRKLVKRLEDKNISQILLGATPDMSQTPAFPWFSDKYFASQSEKQNTILRKIMKEKNIILIDLFNEGKLEYAKSHTYYAKDFFHPAKNGYTLWASLFIKSLKTP